MVRDKDTHQTMKFLCSYGRGGKILPRSTDGKLRYVGGITRVFSVDRSISFAELMVKLRDFCGFSVTLRCQLPNGDLETLISIKSDDDLANLLQEYDRVDVSSSTSQMIRAILKPPASIKQVPAAASKQPSSLIAVDHCSCSRPSPPPLFGYSAVSGKLCSYPCNMQGNPSSLYCGRRPHRRSTESKSPGFYTTVYSH